MFRAALTTVFTLTALPTFAACSGDGYFDQLAPAQQAEITTAAAATPYGEGLIWTATKDDTVLTIVGTIHIYDPALEPIRDRVGPALASADLLMLETTDAEEAALQDALIADPGLYLINEGPTLPELLSPELWDQVAQAASDRGLPSFFVAKFQPWYLGLTLGIPACAIADIANEANGLDHLLMADAQQAGVAIAALEPWRVVFDLLSAGTQAEQIAQMQLSLIDATTHQALMVSMFDAYLAEQPAMVWEMSRVAATTLTDLTPQDAAIQMDAMQNALIDQRNLNWIPVIEAAAETHDHIVIAFGAAHLPGDLGVLNLLADAGWTVTPENKAD